MGRSTGKDKECHLLELQNLGLAMASQGHPKLPPALQRAMQDTEGGRWEGEHGCAGVLGLRGQRPGLQVKEEQPMHWPRSEG